MLLSKMKTVGIAESEAWNRMSAHQNIDAVLVPQIAKPYPWVVIVCRSETVLKAIRRLLPDFTNMELQRRSSPYPRLYVSANEIELQEALTKDSQVQLDETFEA